MTVRTKQMLSCLLAIVLATLAPLLPSQACSTCGCSELCALGMLQEDTTEGRKGGTLLSQSIWGNIILKMAYKRDAKLQILSKKAGLTDDATNLAIFCVAGGVLSQVIINQSTLNPPPPQSDSYLPGSIGLGFNGLTNIVFGAQNFMHWTLRKKVAARQRELAQQVESILHHMEYSETECPEAQKQLALLIGDRAARECEKLWRSSHLMASLPDTDMESENGTVIGAADLATPEPAITISTRLENSVDNP
jgi:hypothetical protein